MSDTSLTLCPKCGRERAAETNAPAWQCPACGIAYQKYRAYLARLKTLVTPLTTEEKATGLVGDGSIWSLIGANVLAVGIAIYEGWGMLPLMAVYWGQSVVIGIANFFRLLSLDRFSTKDFKLNGRSVDPTTSVKWQVSIFFLIHYGFFHALYLLFLATDAGAQPLFDIWFWLCIATFAMNHLWSYRYNRERDRQGTPNIGTLMFTPYLRIVPMHLTIIFGSLMASSPLGILFFGTLKTFADVGMHIVEHRRLKKVSVSWTEISGERS